MQSDNFSEKKFKMRPGSIWKQSKICKFKTEINYWHQQRLQTTISNCRET